MGVGALIIAVSHNTRENAAARYWMTFAIGLIAWWLLLILVSLGFHNKIGTVIGVFMITVAIASLWFGLRAENNKPNKDRWIFLLALLNTLAAALCFFDPFFDYPRISAVVILIVFILIARECLVAPARKNVFALALAGAVSTYSVVGVVVLGRSFLTEPSVSLALNSNSSVGEIYIDVASRFFLGIIMASVVGLASRSHRTSHPPQLREIRVDAAGALYHANHRDTEELLAWARQSDRELTLILLEIQQIPDFVTVFGCRELEEATESLKLVIRSQISPWSMLSQLSDDRLLIAIETTHSNEATTLVDALRDGLSEPLSSTLKTSKTSKLTYRLAFVDTREDGYDWSELIALATSRLTTNTEASNSCN